jgi:hypothetical protein
MVEELMPFLATDLARMQKAQEFHMPDVCHRLVYSRTFDEYNSPQETWTEDTTDIPCGIEQQAGSEDISDTRTTVTYDATIRLPISQADIWDVKDRLLLTRRFGSAILPITYWIASPVQRGPSAIRLLLKKVVM